MLLVRYEDFIKKQDALTFENATTAYQKLVSCNPKNKEEFQELINELTDRAFAYCETSVRCINTSDQVYALYEAERKARLELFIAALN